VVEELSLPDLAGDIWNGLALPGDDRAAFSIWLRVPVPILLMGSEPGDQF
jgi:hypothetical protein